MPGSPPVTRISFSGTPGLLPAVYTTPVVYLYLDAVGAWFARPHGNPAGEAVAPAAE
jgi:hypothetical protein